MTSALQNRLVGTIIVAALVVILVPEFLDGEKRVSKQDFVDVVPVAELVEVQPIPVFDTSQIEDELNQAIELVDELPVDAANAEADSQPVNLKDTIGNQSAQNNQPNAIVTRKPAPKKYSAPPEQADELAQIDIKDSGWVVQLGSFKHQKNVKELLRTLNAAGYRAYSRPVMTTMGELTKVFVGPELDKNTLELALPHLKEITKLKGKITPFEVSAG